MPYTISCITDNQGVHLLTKAFPFGKGYIAFVLLSGPHKGVYTNFKDLCLDKEGIQSPIYKGFYSWEEVEKTLELNTTDINNIKKALEPKPTTIIINADQTKTSPKTYKDFVSPNVPGPINNLNQDNFKKLQKLLFKVHTSETQIPRLYNGVHAYFNQKFVCTNKMPFCEDKISCPCKIKFLFRKARLDLDQFKSFGYEDLAITTKSLLDYGCLESILIPPSDKFEGSELK